VAGEFSGLDKDKKTIVMCHHGGRSAQVASFLSTQAGFKVSSSNTGQ
jgi:rhodanese-related sulfurtransferase